jgi:hypothetical protein
MDFHVPSALADSRVHLPRAIHTRYVPPSGFGYPLDGLRPSNPCQPCFMPAALLGFALRSFPLSQGTRASPPAVDPHAVSPADATNAETSGRLRRPRLLGFDPYESPWPVDTGLGCRPLAAPVGFALSGFCRRDPWSSFRPTSSHALPWTDPQIKPSGASECHSDLAWFRPELAATRQVGSKQPS